MLGCDPRVVWIEDRYYISWCNAYAGCPTIGLGWTKDLKSFHQIENAFLPFNRNGVLFPRKINGKYFMLSRPSDNGHTPFGDIYVSQSPDIVTFPCSALLDAATGRMAIYYGAADTFTALAFTRIDDIMDFVKNTK